jgi:uncharacterized protein YebE (UPF0316 family)
MNIIIFGVGVGVTLIVGMGVITSQVFLGYKPPEYNHEHTKNT